MSNLIDDIDILTNKSFTGTPENLKDLIMALEAKSIFDVENWQSEDEYVLAYLKDLNRIYNIDASPTKPKTKKIASIIGFTPSHMSKKYGYNYSNEAYKKLRKYFKKKLYEDKVTEAWTGLAPGVDICFAHAVIELRELGFPIKLCCAIPTKDIANKQKGAAGQIYNNIIRRADVVEYLSEDLYSQELVDKKNDYIINKSELIYFACKEKSDFPIYDTVIEKQKNAMMFNIDNLTVIE